MKILKATNIKSGYRTKQIVKGLSLTLKEGEFCALLGLNGCGKSTLIKTLLAFISSSDGKCELDGQNIWDLDEKDRAKVIAYIPQRGSSIYGRTVLDVVLMGFNARLGIFDRYTDKQKEVARKTLEKLEIRDYENLLYEELSEGQKQLVILARTMVQNTPVVFMDEPDSSLDFKNKNHILGIIKKMIKAEGKIGLIALHDPDAALNYCDRLLLMKDGKIIYDIDKSEFNDYNKLEKALSDIYGKIKIIDNNGKPVMVLGEDK